MKWSGLLMIHWAEGLQAIQKQGYTLVMGGNVPLHEWTYNGEYPPKLNIDENSDIKEEKEPTENVITWLFEENSFVPCGKIVGEEKYIIVCDYLGTPTLAHSDDGSLIWEREIDIYGTTKRLKGDKALMPIMFQG